ncbi:MAG: UDP-N-acetylmuramoyl-tripeptide--D-alanyl-D-alanine ligase [Steroidobacteraceae bacterium]
MKRTLQAFATAVSGQLSGADAPFARVLIDSRALQAGDLFVALPGSRVDGHDFVASAAAAGAAGALVSRRQDVALPQIVVGDVAAALAQAAQAWRAQFAIPLVGVAGSNGKTTVKEMIAAVLAQRGATLATRGNLNNHLGVPLTLFNLEAEHRAAVIEMGANRAGDVAQLVEIARPDVGLITNAGAEHLEGFGSLEGVARAEGEMVAGLAPGGTAIINADDPYAPLWRSMTRARVLGFGLNADADVRARQLRFDIDAAGFNTRFALVTPQGSAEVQLALAGRHNVVNALAAAAAAGAAGATLAQIVAGLAAMRAVPGRLQFRQTRQGAWLIDDSYNANPSSVQAGLEVLATLSGSRWLVLGDMAELGEHAAAAHRSAGALARLHGVERLFCFGELSALAADEFGAGAQKFTDMAALCAALDRELSAPVRLLVKGSRVNRLERLVNALIDNPGAVRQAG